MLSYKSRTYALCGTVRRDAMNGRELYPDAEQRRRIMDFIMAAGQTLLENGAP